MAVAMALTFAVGVSGRLSSYELMSAEVIGHTNTRYASWTVDSSYNRGFVHIDFRNPNLLAAARSLEPSTLRFGGTGNDYLIYDMYTPCSSNNDNDTQVCLNETHWDALYNLAHKSGTDFVFGISFNLTAACSLRDKYVWNPAASRALIDFLQAKHNVIWGFELGNEINNLRNKCSLSPAQQAAAFETFARLLSELYPTARTRPRLLGPDIGWLHAQSWLTGFLENYSSLYAVTYHVYSSLDKTDWNFTKPIDNAVRDNESWYPPLVHKMAPGSQVWAGEDGPVSGGQDGSCGGEFRNGSSTNMSVCGTYATVPWLANDLGHRAALGFKQYHRQDLLGGRYGLLGINNDNEALGENDAVRIFPDFWVMYLWKRTMGTTVLNGTSSATDLDPSVRIYAHCGTPPSPHAPLYITKKDGKPLGLVLLNINSTGSRHVTLPNIGPLMTWTLAADPKTGVFGQRATLNNEILPTLIADGKPMGPIPVAGRLVAPGAIIRMPSFSVTFAIGTCPCTLRPASEPGTLASINI